MKKVISLLLALVLCLSLCACGKSEAVKNVEAMIDALMGSIEYNVEEIEAIYAAFAALSEKEQKKVRNYTDFSKLSDDFYAASLVGTWYPFAFDIGSLEERFSPPYYIVLNADHTYESVAGEAGSTTGTWEVKNKCLTLLGLKELNTLIGGHGGKDDIALNICYEDGFIFLNDDTQFIKYYKEKDYFSILGDVLLAVDCANVNLSDYLGFTTFELYATDEWGARTGSVYDEIILKNLLYEDGWMYFGVSEDFQIEVLYPDYTEVFYDPDGSKHTQEYSSGSYTVFGCPFSHYSTKHLPDLGAKTKEFSSESDLSTGSFTFGRAKGALYFINNKYVADVRKDENDCRYIVLDNSQKYCALVLGGYDKMYTDQWLEGLPEY